MIKAAVGTLVAALVVAGCSGTSSSGGASPVPTVNASNPPAPTANGQQKAPSDLAAALLQPTDLGMAWRPAETPATALRTPPPFDAGPPAIYELHTNLVTDHWNGSEWVTDQTVNEIATNYGSAANAAQWVAIITLQARGQYTSTKVAGVTVWRFKNKPTDVVSQEAFAVGPMCVRMTIGLPAQRSARTVTVDDVLRKAIRNLKAHPVADGATKAG